LPPNERPPASGPAQPVPLCDLTRQVAELQSELMAAVERVLVSGRYILGDEVAAFEQEVAAYLGARYGIGVASGTDALELALRALGIGPGDRVLTSPLTFFATASAIVATGADPVFADIDPQTFNLDPAEVSLALQGRSPVLERLGVDPGTIRAVIPVHLYGQAAGVHEIVALARDHRLAVVEDAAQAMGAEAGGKAGTFGDAGCLSFFPTKTLGGFGDGGQVVTDDPELATRVRLLRRHGSSRPHEHHLIGTNSRLDEIQAALLRVKLRHLDAWIAARRTHARFYDAALGDLDGVTCPPGSAGHTYHQYTLRIGGGRRDEVHHHLAGRGVETQAYYRIPVPLQPALSQLGYRPGDFPAAEAASAEVLSIPMFPELRECERQRVVEAIRQAVRPKLPPSPPGHAPG
jgi:dTDP-4-amino-4,6-dideoxygalactose transaminase